MICDSIADRFDGLESGTQQLWACDLRASLLSPRAFCSRIRKTDKSSRRNDLSPQSRLVLDNFDKLVSNEQQELARELRAGMRRRRHRLPQSLSLRDLKIDSGIIDLDEIASTAGEKETRGRATGSNATPRLDMASNTLHTDISGTDEVSSGQAMTCVSDEGGANDSPTKEFWNRVLELELERDKLQAALKTQQSLASALQGESTISEPFSPDDACDAGCGFEAYEALDAEGELAIEESTVDDGSSDASDRTVIISQKNLGFGSRSLGRKTTDPFGDPYSGVTSELASTSTAPSSGCRQCPESHTSSTIAHPASIPHRAEEAVPTLLTQSYGYQLFHISAIPLSAEEGAEHLSKSSATSPFHKSVKNLLLW